MIDTMVDAAGTWMLEGHGVSIGQMGYLKPAITSKSSDTQGEEKILRKRVLFQPSKSFKGLIDTMPLERITGRMDDEEEDPGSGGGGEAPDPTPGGGGSDFE